jgi:hypothetical protein
MFGVNHVTVEWTGSDALSGLAHFEVKVDDLAWENVAYNTSMALTGLSDGVHVVMVKAVDNATNENVTSVTFTVDTTAPWVIIIDPANGLHTNMVNIRMNWTAVDNTTGIDHITVWNDSGAPVTLLAANVTYLFEGLAEGAHTLHVEVFDLVGNSQVKTVSVVVDLTAPLIIFGHPQQTDPIQHINDTVINATWMIFDLSPIVMIEVAINGSYVDIGSLNYHEFADVTAGQHQISVRATDSAGNVGTGHVDFVVDRTAPTVVSHTPASGAIVLPNAVVKVNFSEAMNQTSVLFTGITGTKTWNTAGNEVTLTHADLTYATLYNLVVSGKDLAGNAVSASWSFSVVTQVTGTINDDKGNPIVNATVKISQGGVTVAEGATDANGHFALIVDGVGTYNITVSKTGFQDLVQNDKALGVGQTNSLTPMAMTPNPDYTLVIVGVIVVVAVVLAALFLMRRKK